MHHNSAYILLLLLCFSTSEASEPSDLAATIDKHIDKRLSDKEITPAPIADDAEFLRRVYLDIAGKIPPVSQVRHFLADRSPDKRREIVDELLESANYINNFTNLWRDVLLPEANADFQVRYLVPSFEAWLRQKLIDDTSYDKLAREILTMRFNTQPGQNTVRMIRAGQATPVAFYQAKQVAPENLAAATSRMFLGIRIECAQCHDHPFDTWKQNHFWSFAAFYAGLERVGPANVFGQVREASLRREITIPNTEKVVQAAYLDGSQPKWESQQSPRTTLSEWITSSKNPYFARTGANRLWAHFMGVGIVDPVDDFSANNPPSHPELLDELARGFAENNFSIKFMVRSITSSKTYQRTSEKTHSSQSDASHFARMSLKGLTPRQLFDSVSQATGYFRPYQRRQPFAVGINSPEAEFLETFSNDSDRRTERSVSILQALSMMNGGFVTGATDLQNSQTLAAIVEYPFSSTADRIESLYLATLNRKPSKDELSRFVNYVDDGGTKGDSEQALGDVFWALLNSSEFMFNH